MARASSGSGQLPRVLLMVVDGSQGRGLAPNQRGFTRARETRASDVAPHAARRPRAGVSRVSAAALSAPVLPALYASAWFCLPSVCVPASAFAALSGTLPAR